MKHGGEKLLFLFDFFGQGVLKKQLSALNEAIDLDFPEELHDLYFLPNCVSPVAGGDFI